MVIRENRRKSLKWFDELSKLGSRPGLGTVSVLLGLMGDPQKDLRCIHVTGTNGKGSTSVMISTILENAGYKVGLFTSPYLSNFTESIKVNGRDIELKIAEELLGNIKTLSKKMVEAGQRHPTSFEVLTSMTFQYFSNSKVDYAVLEVGMGGRDDATNVVNAIVSIITNVSLEHTAWLGDTVEKIAEVKAGIVKNDSILVTAVKQPSVVQLLQKICDERNSKMYLVGRDIKVSMVEVNPSQQRFNVQGINDSYVGVETKLIGEHQALNAACAIGAIEALNQHGAKIPKSSIMTGLSKATWPGRFEIVQEKPLVILDGAKDLEAIKALKRTVNKLYRQRKIVTIVSISSDKNIPEMIKTLASITDTFIVTKHRVVNRTADISTISSEIMKTGKPYKIANNATQAIHEAYKLTDKNDLILITGSVFFIGEAREYWFPVHPIKSGYS